MSWFKNLFKKKCDHHWHKVETSRKKIPLPVPNQCREVAIPNFTGQEAFIHNSKIGIRKYSETSYCCKCYKEQVNVYIIYSSHENRWDKVLTYPRDERYDDYGRKINV